MKAHRNVPHVLFAVLTLLLSLNFPVTPCFAQGTVFTYQGRLDSSGVAYNGTAEFQPTLWNAQSGGSQIAANNPSSVVVNVTNGLFQLPLDFGANFSGPDRWLQMDVRIALGPFTTLTPRQQLTPAPYAMYSANAGTAATAASASSVSAANITGTLLLTQLPAGVVTNTQNGVSLTGSFTGDGGALSNISSGALTLLSSSVSIAAWGDHEYGQATVPPGLTNVIAIAAGIGNSLALKGDGTVVAWGAGFTNNTNSQIDAGQSIIPAGLSGVRGIAASFLHCAAVLSNGTVVAWGFNGMGQTNVPPGLNNAVAVSVGAYHTLALKSDGTVAVWGTNGSGQLDVPPGLNDVKMISAGLLNNLVLRSNGTVVAWGAGFTNDPSGTGQFGQSIIPPGLSNVVAIASGGVHSLALKADGTVVAWGAGTSNNPSDGVNFGQSIVPTGLSNVVAIAAGLGHSVALKADGTVVAWGDIAYGQTNVPPGLDNVFALAAGAGAHHTLALRKRSDAPVAWLDSDNTFNGSLQVGGDLRVSGEVIAGSDLRLNDVNLWLRSGGDVKNGLGWFGANKNFGGFNDPAPDGPVLFGEGGGGLATMGTNGTKVALAWDAQGRVGIGTTTPTVRLSLGSDFGASKFQVYDGFGPVGLGYTNSSFRFHLGGDGGSFAFLDAPTGNQLVTIQSFGNVGIGTVSPNSRLDVRGSIKLGSTGQYYAPGSGEDLRIIRGVVNASGIILAGSGFTVTKGPTGFFTVNFTSSFSDTPAVVVTAQSGIDRIATCTSVSSSSAGIWTRDSAGTATDNQFNFIAIGSK